MATKKSYAAKPILRSTTQAGNALREALPHATVERTGAKARGAGKPLQIVLPEDTMKALKHEAVEQETSVRAIILQALAKAGYPVPATEIRDRRRA